MPGIIGQEVVHYDVCEHGPVQAGLWPENGPGGKGGRMGICKGIDGTVQADALLYGLRIQGQLSSFHKVTDHIAGHQVRLVKGEVGVGKEVHR